MGKDYSDNFHSIKNTKDLTIRQMFDISQKLTFGQSDEIFGMNAINWEDSSWKHLFLIGDEEVTRFLHKSLRLFRFCVVFCKDEREPIINYWLGGQVDVVQEFITIQLMVSQRNPSRIFSQDSPDRECRTRRFFIGRIILMSMFNDISWWCEESKQECELSAQIVSICARRFSPGRWSFFRPGSEKRSESRRVDDVKIPRKQTPSFPIYKTIISRSAQKQMWWRFVNTLLLCQWGSHIFYQSAQ